MVRPSVDLPQPDSPTSPTTSPLASDRLMPSTALTVPTCCLSSRPLSTGKWVLTFWSSRNVSVDIANAGPRLFLAFDADQLDVEEQGGTRLDDRAPARVAISEFGC